MDRFNSVTVKMDDVRQMMFQVDFIDAEGTVKARRLFDHHAEKEVGMMMQSWVEFGELRPAYVGVIEINIKDLNYCRCKGFSHEATCPTGIAKEKGQR